MFGLNKKENFSVEKNIRSQITDLLNHLLDEDKVQKVRISDESRETIKRISQRIVAEPSIKENSPFYHFVEDIDFDILSNNSELIQVIVDILNKIDS